VAEQRAGKVLNCLAHLIALPGITIEDHDEVETALRYARQGIDFADALRLAASKACSEMLTFDDRGYARRARGEIHGTSRGQPRIDFPSMKALRVSSLQQR